MAHLRKGLLAVSGCIALGGLLAGVAHFVAPPARSDIDSAIAHLESLDAPQGLASASPEPPASPSPEADEERDGPEEAKSGEDEPEEVAAEAPPVRYRATSVFGAKQRGSLACRIPGQDAFTVEWNSTNRSAVAHFANARIAGSMQQRANASNTVESALQFALEDGGHSLSLTINDAGEMNASVDGRESSGTCSPA